MWCLYKNNPVTELDVLFHHFRYSHTFILRGIKTSIAGAAKLKAIIESKKPKKQQVIKMEENKLWLVQKCRDLKNLWSRTRGCSACWACICWGLGATLFRKERLFPSILSIRLVISLEDHVLPLICKTPTRCQTHLGIISFPFHRAPSFCARRSKHLWAVLRVCAPPNAQLGSDSELPSTQSRALCLCDFFFFWRHSLRRVQPINATPARVIVLLNAYKYIKRCLPLIYSINCLQQIH